MKLFIKLILSAFLIVSFAAQAVDIQVRVDRTQIELNETFTLTFESSEDPDDEPDFSPLEKDFQILSQGTSSNISIINGQYTRLKKWNVSLLARRKGTITIPQIKFGSDSSPSYQITINQPEKSSGKAGEALISELDVNTTSTYPQAQIIITKRLLSSNNINAYEFSELETSGVPISEEKLGEVKQYQTKRGSTSYLVLEQRYAIYPQTAGELKIEPVVASARIAIQGSRGNRSTFDPFRSNTKTIRRSSASKSVTVKPVPDSFIGKHWLAAKEVQLVDEFPESDNFTAGEPITRTLLLVADGQSSSQLPEFTLNEINGLKQYPDKPLLKNNISDDGITGIQQLKVAIIPSAKGTYKLPAISVPWWNTQTNKLEIAEIKARTFTVGKSSQASKQDKTSPITAPPAIQDIKITEPEVNKLNPLDSTDTKLPDNSLLWKIISFILAASLLYTLFLLWQKNRNTSLSKTVETAVNISQKQALKRLKQACDINDAKSSKDALLQWAEVTFTDNPAHSLGEISNRVDQAFAEKIDALNSSLYRDNANEWLCNDLFELCSQYTENLKSKTQSKDHDKLESLYK
ncbi:MAG: BatD family protein [Gammaproteobacteria bacterium]|nr:BatD family protein [Gammaproteobacteria bacterium]